METPRESISDAEARFEEWRRTIGLWLGPILGIIVWYSGEDTQAQRLAAVMAFCATWWICEPVHVAATALLAATLTVVLGIATPKDAFAAFGNNILFLFVGSFFIAEAMKNHGLGERLAARVASMARGRIGVLCALSLVAFSLSLFMSNTAACAVILPIALSVARSTKDRAFGAALVLSIAYGASIGGIGTPIGTPPNLIGLRAMREGANVDVGFLQWMAVGLPIGLTMLCILWVLLALRFRIRRGPIEGLKLPERKAMSSGEIAVAVSLAVAAMLWITPGVLDLLQTSEALGERLRPIHQWFRTRLNEEVVAILASMILFLWPIGGGRRALSWKEATLIDWGTVLLFGAGILLGDLASKTGLAARIGTALSDFTGANDLWSITALVTGACILLSEATSNTATATLMLPITISLAHAANVPVLPPALGATLGCSFGFMLPISTGPNAMAYGTGQVSIAQMATAGIVFDALGFVVIVGGLRLLCPIVGLV